jgi:uncharacterized protein YndB with AHSA1/START domain
MGSFELERHIGRAPERVWNILSDVRRTPEWYDAITRVVPLGETPTGTGAQFEIVRTLPGGQAVNVVEITDYAVDERFTLTSRTGPTPFSYRYELTPNEAGTRLVLLGDISAEGLGGPAARLGLLATTLFKNGMRTNLAALARLVEASPGGA